MSNEVTYIALPHKAIVCAARHYVAAHESAAQREIVSFGNTCSGCEYLMECRGQWRDTADPVFRAANIFPKILRPGPFPPSCIEGSPALCRLWRRIHAFLRKHRKIL